MLENSTEVPKTIGNKISSYGHKRRFLINDLQYQWNGMERNNNSNNNNTIDRIFL